MKMILAIVQNEDAPELVEELNHHNFFVTKLASTGGFLKKGNTTLLTGVEDAKVEEVRSIIKQFAGKRRQMVFTTSPSAGSMASHMATSVPVNMEVGGATIFVLNVENFQKF